MQLQAASRSLVMIFEIAVVLIAVATVARAEDGPPADPTAKQAEREAAFAKMLSGATLDGNFTMTDGNHDATNLTHDKYTLGEVKKVSGKDWVIPARIQYGDKDFTLPLTLPVEWAGDTPVIIVENVGLPGMGGMSARVMFFADHYAGFWQHGTRTGNLFGVIRHEATSAESNKPADSEKPAH